MATVRVRPYKSTSRQFATRAEAREWGDRHEADLKKRRQRSRAPIPSLPRLTLGQLITEYLADPDTQSLRTYDGVQRIMEWWANHYGGERVISFGPMALREARARLMPGRQPATVNRYLSMLRACWKFGINTELVPRDCQWPTRLMLKEPPGRTRFLSDDELERLLKAADEYSPLMAAAVRISVGCGVRRSELLRIRWADVDLRSKTLRVLLSKNDEARTVHIPDSIAASIVSLRAVPVLGTTVLCDERGQPVDRFWLEYHWRELRARACLVDFRWHDLRHSCASLLAQNRANLLEIGTVLGHKSTTATRRYAHLVQGAPVTGHEALDKKLRR